uniref:Fe-S oxidoreductase n=1 Tax=uncultured marine thaumarchaeote AD1000_33_B07 TaxID=1455908 RepID=A0A075FPJ6_9ARCH|nr:Fe-S oxidoreductase [uncultured marine thaumarchaeote AD1000_33_B07]
MFDFICNYAPHTNGVAKFAPYGLRKVEAGLLRDGFKREDVVVAHPDHIEKFIGPETEVVGTHEMDPLGMGPVTMTFTYGRRQMSYDEFYCRHLHRRINAAKKKMVVMQKLLQVVLVLGNIIMHLKRLKNMAYMQF